MASGTTGGTRRRLIWTFGPSGCAISLDEQAWRLKVDDGFVEIEQKPLEILLVLLQRAGEAVTKAELLDAVWPDVTVVDSSLPTAIAKLRRALGRHADLVETVPRIGYRLTSPTPVTREAVPDRAQLGFKPDMPVPGAAGWRLVRRLSRGETDDVWLAAKGDARRVFKFAETPGRLRQLKRENAIARLLAQAPKTDAFVLPQARALDRLPAWLAFADAGSDLTQWLSAHPDAPLEQRLAIVASAARAVASAHRLGVLHMDVKPSNLLIGDDAQVRVIDFGCGALTTVAPDLTGLTQTSLTLAQGASSGGGTPLYLAPEIIAGQTPTSASDIYALGLILFQLVIGDLHRPLAPGWEAQIDDALLRDDIAQAAAFDPQSRLASADLLAERLEALPERRIAQAQGVAADEAAARLRQAVERARIRRPWIALSAVVLVAGLAMTSFAAWQAMRQRDEARRQSANAQAISDFLADDLLARGDPALSGMASETLLQATQRAQPDIAIRFRTAPHVAAQLYHTLARVYEQQSQWAAARDAYDQADAAYGRAGEGRGKSATINRLQHAFMEALSYQADSLDRARKLLADETAQLPPPDRMDPETQVWLSSARGMLSLADGDPKTALAQFGAAATGADALPNLFNARLRNDFHQRHAFTYVRLGDGKSAEAEIRPLLAAQMQLLGPKNPDVLILRLNLGQAYLFQQRYTDAVRELTSVLPELRAQLGPDHRLVQLALGARGQALGMMGRYAESVRDERALVDIALKSQGLHSYRALTALSDLSTSECRAPDLNRGIADGQTAYEGARATFGEQEPLTQAIGAAWAQCLIDARRDDQAFGLLQGLSIKAIGDLNGNPNWGAERDLMLAEIAVHRKNWRLADETLTQIEPVFSAKDADRFEAALFQSLNRQVAANTR
ncbi:MAG: protein kinase domain-containing protein [Asticcacaulis sp.]|uniref:protein kinase domain-containing protein n=1 Tax=Asticcacaulis sp. TaxID=1872648 RepID=UPI003F7CD3C3